VSVIGVDLGLDGGLAVLDDAGDVMDALPMPTIPSTKGRRAYDVPALVRLLTSHRPRLVIAEQLHAVPRSMGGSSSSFSRGLASGLLEGACSALGVPLQLVTPQAWQRVMLAGTPGSDTKARAIHAAGRLFPRLSLVPPGKRKAHDGVADALLLASFGRRSLSPDARAIAEE
jgi:crossover junction endodeoxyribonuclease RuvC